MADMIARAMAASAQGASSSIQTDIIGVHRSYLLDDFLLPSDNGDYGLALARAVAEAAGRTITCAPEKTYNFATAANNLTDFEIDMNGSMFVAPPSGRLLSSVQTKANYTAGNYFSTVEGAGRFTIPAGVNLVAGDWVKLESDVVFQTIGSYLYGEWIEIARVAGGIAFLRDPFLLSYRVDRIRVRKNKRQNIFNGHLDLTATTPQASGAVPSIGINLCARNAFVDLRVYGNDYAGIGVATEAYNAEVGGFAHGITNMQALNDGTGSGRVGYGFSTSARRGRFFGQAVNCKHGFTTASRTGVAEKIVFDRCNGATPKGEQDVMDTAGLSTKWQAILDVHAGCLMAEVVSPVLDGVNALIAFRNKRMEIRGGDMMSRGVTTTFGQDGLIYMSESDDQFLKIAGPIRARADRTTAGLAIPSLINFYGMFGNQKFSVEARTIEGDNLRMSATRTQDGSSGSITFGDLIFDNISGNWIGGPLIGSEADSRNSGAVGSITIGYAPNFKIDTPNYQRQPIIMAQNFASVGKVKLYGDADVSLLSNSYNAAHIGRSLAMAVGTGSIGDVDYSGLRLKAYRIGLDIASSSSTAPGHVNGNNSSIEYGLAGLPFGDPGNTGTNGRAVKMQFTTAPKRKSTFAGATFVTGSTVANLGIDFVGQVRNDDISGLITNDGLPQVSGTYFYVPTNVRLIGAAEDTAWRTGAETFYINRKGHLTVSAAPSNGNANGIQNGTIAKARVPSAGGVSGYVLISGSTWKAEAALAP